MFSPSDAPGTPWPRPLTVAVLLAFVLADGFFWVWGFVALFGNDLPTAGRYLTWALVLMVVGGWAWRWWVAKGWIGGHATIRFGGA